jgi:ribulose-phosphate 3-epimerase
MIQARVGKISKRVKMAAGLFWADYGILGAQVEELTEAGVDWIHLEMRDGKYMDFGVPRGGIDVLEGIRKHTDLEIEVQLQMMRPSHDVYDQIAEVGGNLITLPIETTGEMLMQHVTYIKDKLGLKVGVWAWQGLPVLAFEPYLPFVEIIEYESRARFWKPKHSSESPHTIDPIVVEATQQLHDMLVMRGLENKVDLMEDGGLNAGNVAEFVAAGMTVGEFSSPFLKGSQGKLPTGIGAITAAVQRVRAALDAASEKYRDENGLKRK